MASLARANGTAAIGEARCKATGVGGNGVEGGIDGRERERERESNLVKSRTLVVLASLNV